MTSDAAERECNWTKDNAMNDAWTRIVGKVYIKNVLKSLVSLSVGLSLSRVPGHSRPLSKIGLLIRALPGFHAR